MQSLLTGPRTIEVRDAPPPGPVAPGMVRLRLATASLCGTDMHYYRHFANAGFALSEPVTLGHEACAHVADPNGSGLEAGTLVAIDPVMPCGTCEACARGAINMCPTKRFPGSATTVPHIDGFFREGFDFPADRLTPVDASVDPDHLTFAEPLACAMHAVALSGAGEGTRVLVTGSGPMGLLATLAAVERGAVVTATDARAEPLEAARRAGASAVHLAGRDDTGPLEGAFDVVIEASGSPHAFNAALHAVRKQGTIVILSIIQPSETAIELQLVTFKEARVVGSVLFTHEFAHAVDLIVSGRFDFEGVIAGRYPVSRLGEACEAMAEGRAAGKVLIKPEAWAAEGAAQDARFGR